MISASAKNDKSVSRGKEKKGQAKKALLKPEECLRSVRCIIDTKLFSFIGPELSTALVNSKIKYLIKDNSIPWSIFWERLQQREIHEFPLLEKYNTERPKLLFLTAKDFVKHLDEEELIKSLQIKDFKTADFNLIVFGWKKSIANLSPNKRFSIRKFLAKLEILFNLNIWLLENKNDVINCILNFNKAIAEIPIKLQNSEKLKTENVFLMNDNEAVRIQGLVGLGRLWQQHLLRLPLVTIKKAEEVTRKYNQPKDLIDEIENIQSNQKVNLVQQKDLNEKLLILYTSRDPNQLL